MRKKKSEFNDGTGETWLTLIALTFEPSAKYIN
jgi:hypothetical protein